MHSFFNTSDPAAHHSTMQRPGSQPLIWIGVLETGCMSTAAATWLALNIQRLQGLLYFPTQLIDVCSHHVWELSLMLTSQNLLEENCCIGTSPSHVKAHNPNPNVWPVPPPLCQLCFAFFPIHFPLLCCKNTPQAPPHLKPFFFPCWGWRGAEAAASSHPLARSHRSQPEMPSDTSLS